MSSQSSSALKPLAGERVSGESDLAVIACNTYLRMGVRRSLRKLDARYRAQKADENEPDPPTDKWSTLTTWSVRFDWVDRAAEYDAATEDEKNTLRDRIMNEGLALEYERVRKLKDAAEFLEEQMYETDAEGNYINVWCPDEKMIGTGDAAQPVVITRFNAALFQQWRGIHDDLAKETGGRRQKTEITGKDGGPIEVNAYTDEQRTATLLGLLERRAAIERARAEADGSDSVGDGPVDTAAGTTD